jgi:hypothetical protein
MREFIRTKQAELKKIEDEVQGELAALKEQIIEAQAAGAIDDEIVAHAKKCYAYAMYYYTFQHAGADIPGGKVAHAYERMLGYLDQSLALTQEALALLQQ